MIPYYEWFYNVILTSANSVPIQSQWIAFFTNPVDLNRAVQAGLYENGFGYFTLAAGAAVNTAQGGMGALFANSVTIPSEGMNAAKLGPEGSGMLKGSISNGRMEMENLKLSFLDTNMSFCDYNLRPWSIYASHRSLKDPKVKTTITIMQLAKTGEGNTMLPRAIWTFHDACPVSIASEEWNYGGDNVVSRQVEFSYNYYLLNADPGITSIKTVASVLDGTPSKHISQPKDVGKGGLTGHGGSTIVTPSQADTTDLSVHIDSQPVVRPDDDTIRRGVNIGLDILNGNSNVIIGSDDVIDRLKNEGTDILNSLKVIGEDTPDHSGSTQFGHIEKEPTGPSEGELDHLTKRQGENVQSGKVPVGGNSKEDTKALSDTPIFFPGDGDEDQKVVAGRRVGGSSDTPTFDSNGEEDLIIDKEFDTPIFLPDDGNRIQERVGGRTVDGDVNSAGMDILKHQHVEVEKTGDVGKDIPLQIIITKQDDTRSKV
jgi:hypothetical protein